MYYVRLLVCMSMYTLFCNAMDPVKHQEKAKKNLLNSLFLSIVRYKYEETKSIIEKNPSLVDTFGSYKLSNSSCLEITPVHLASLEGNSVALEQLLAVSKKSVQAGTEEGHTPLHLASNERVVKMLLEHGAEPNKHNDNKYTPLHAALYGISSYQHKPYFDVAYYLLQHEADINTRCQFGATVLHAAISSGTMSSEFAQFLFDNGADGDIKNNRGETPFDQVTMVQREVFQRSGYCYYHWMENQQNDPFELLKKDPQAFLNTNTIWNIVKDLYTTAQQQEQRRQPISEKSDAIVVQVGRGSKSYTFKRPSFADLEIYFGKTAIDCLRNYFEGLLREDQTAIIKNIKKPVVYDANWVDSKGDSLLHTAARHKRSDMIKFLIDSKSIDCTIKNNEGKLALDCMVDHASKAAFFDVLVQKFFAQKLNTKTENLVLNRIFYSEDISKKGRLYYFLMTLRHHPEKSWFFLQQGINVNGTYKKVSPLACAINPWLKTSWRKVPAINKYNICALLAHGAKIDEKMIKACHGYMKELLQQKYDAQN